MNTKRFQKMQKVQAAIRPELKEFKLYCPVLDTSTLGLLQRKLYTPSIRSYFTYYMAKYIQECAKSEGLDLEDIPPPNLEKHLPFLAEANMSVMYLHNQILDAKGEVTAEEKICNNVLGANVLKDKIYAYVNQHFESKQVPFIQEKLRNIFLCVDVAQYYDRNFGLKGFQTPHKTCIDAEKITKLISIETVENIIKKYAEDSEISHHRIRNYFKRNYLISAALFKGFTEIIIHLLGYHGKEKENCLRFAESYGLMMQLVNDNADFVLEKGTASKADNDVQKDLYNQIITLPMIFHLANRQDGRIHYFISNRREPCFEGWHNHILREIVLSHALPSSVKVGIDLADQSKNYLNNGLASGKDLLDLLSVAYNNRYYHHIFKAKKLYLKKMKVNELYRCEENISKRKRSEKETENAATVGTANASFY